ncbi:MAG TPA: hypothetical protein VK975_05850 [Acidimicrobiales bacterium]|nr:hypothetical protein [Acidimicrobiales bacterium]
MAGDTRLTDFLERPFEVEPGHELLTLPWDWRRNLRVAARRLARLADESLARQRAAGYPRARVALIGHNVGGLVASSFALGLGGHASTRALVTLGTPFSERSPASSGW